MRVLVTGAGGQLGHDLLLAAERRGDDAVGVTHADVDVTDRHALLAVVDAVAPDVVVNAAAWTAVDACEGDADRAFAVNGAAVGGVVEACRRRRAHLVQVSTDYVFDGTLDRPYREDDATNPQSVYGASKLAGEREAAELGEAALVARTAWVAGEHGNNMVKTILRLAGEHDELSFVADQRGCPTFTADLAPLLLQLAAERRTGTFHVTNQRPVSWYEFAREVVAAAGRDPSMVRPITTAELDPPRPAPRPANSVLDNAALRAAGVPLLRDFREPLAELVGRLTHPST
jgi:dTDP-4-dehydrorhamnose reductase